jgi:hypothetical protein
MGLLDFSYSAVNGKKPRLSDKQYAQEDLLSNAKNAAGLLADFTPVIGGIKGAYKEAKQGNPVMAGINAVTVPLDLVTMGGASALAKLGLIGMVKKGSGYGKIPEMLETIDKTYKETGSIPKLKKVEAAILDPDEIASFNNKRHPSQPKLVDGSLGYNGKHHYNSRANTPDGNGYAVDDLHSQIDSVTSGNLVPKVDRQGVAMQQPVQRDDGYGKKVKDKMSIMVDNNGRGELFSVIPDGDGLKKGQKVQRSLLDSGDQAHPVSDGVRIAAAEPLETRIASEGLLGNVDPLDSMVLRRDMKQSDYDALSFDQKQILAQRRAALPVDQGGLGLAPDNTYSQRADALNAIDAYHGTADEVTQLDRAKFGSSTGAESAKRAWWAVDEPNTARGYADYAANQAPVKRLLNEADRLEKKGDWDGYDRVLGEAETLEAKFADSPLNGQNIMPLKIIPQNPKFMDAKGAEFTDLEGGVNSLLRQAKIGGNDVAVIKNLSDDVAFNGRPATHFGVLNPSAVRSRFAAFDPFRINDPDIMGYADPRLLGLTAGGGLLGLGAYKGYQE